MSANNWTQCPKCDIRLRAEADKKDQLVRDAYGKLPEDKFLRMRDEAHNFRKSLTDDVFAATLREDYEIGIYSELFEISYSSRCTTCGFAHSFKHTEKLI
jgi:hypothetical protein